MPEAPRNVPLRDKFPVCRSQLTKHRIVGASPSTAGESSGLEECGAGHA